MVCLSNSKRINDLFKASFVFKTIHFFLLDAGFAAGIGSGLLVHQDGDDLVAKTLLGEAADLEVAFGEGGVICEQSLDKAAMQFVDQFDEIVPLAVFEVEVQG